VNRKTIYRTRRVVVDFWLDEKTRPVTLQILHYSQNVLAGIQGVEMEPNPSNLSVLSFVMAVPTKIPQENVWRGTSTHLPGNKSLPFGSLNFSEIENSVYSPMAFLFSKPPHWTLLIAVLRTAEFVRETFFSAIDEVAEGTTTVNKILKQPVPAGEISAAGQSKNEIWQKSIRAAMTLESLTSRRRLYPNKLKKGT